MEVYDVVIIGAGPAGMTAGLYAARAQLKTVVLERLFAGGQVATTGLIENYPGFPEGVDGLDLSSSMEQQAKEMGLTIRYDDVEEMILQGDVKQIKTTGGMIQAKAVILCMGASPKLLGVPGEDTFRGTGVSYCATCDGAFYKNKRVAVIGGGDTAAEDALYLQAMCSEVLLVHRRDQLRAAQVLANRALEADKVVPLWNTQLLAIRGNKKVESILLSTQGVEHEMAVEGVFIAVGTDPATALVASQLTLDEQGYIVAGEDTRTSLPMVYAAGDIRTKPLRQIVTATSDGAVAIYSLLHDQVQGS